MEYEIDPTTGAAMVPLEGGRLNGLYALVDIEDVPLIEVHKWRAACTNPHGTQITYAVASNPEGGLIYMHRLILGLVDRLDQADHANSNGLDNRRSNLRAVTAQENQFNRRVHRNSVSGYKGVSWAKRERRWRADISKDGKRRWLGYFANPVDAACAYDAAARELYGEFAYLNFPESEAAR